MQNTTERRQLLLEVLNVRRKDTLKNLAFEFGVSISTIKRDITILSCYAPIYTIQGNSGGVFLMDGYYTNRQYLSKAQEKAINDIIDGKGVDIVQLNSILLSFSKPKL